MPDESPNEFVRLLEVLTDAAVDFVVVGGTAAVFHGASTATYDLDILMPFTQTNCERLLRAITPIHPRLSHTPDKRPLTFSADSLASFKNLYLLTDLGRMDVLGSLPPFIDTSKIFAEADNIDIAGMRVRIVSLPTLIEVKAAMGRAKDKHVEAELRAIAAFKKSHQS